MLVFWGPGSQAPVTADQYIWKSLCYLWLKHFVSHPDDPAPTIPLLFKQDCSWLLSSYLVRCISSKPSACCPFPRGWSSKQTVALAFANGPASPSPASSCLQHPSVSYALPRWAATGSKPENCFACSHYSGKGPRIKQFETDRGLFFFSTVQYQT